MNSELFQLLFVAVVLVLVVVVFVRISLRLRRGGGSLTTIMLGSTDGFLDRDKSKAAETIVDRNAGKTRNPLSPSSQDPIHTHEAS